MAAASFRGGTFFLLAAVSSLLSPASGSREGDRVDLCGYDQSLCGLTSYSGFVDIPGKGALFYWYFQPETVDPSAPLVIWLQGGPGSSSMMGTFFEMGPVMLSEKSLLTRRPANETWASYVPVLFVDSPLGTGWSWANSGGYAASQIEVAKDLVIFLQQVAERLPTGPRRLVVAGESYGGHFVPALGEMLLTTKSPFQLEAIAVGDGLTDPATQVLTKPGEAFAFGLLDEAQLAKAEELAHEAHDAAQAKLWGKAVDARQAMEDFVKNVSAINPYDVRTTEQYDWMQLRMQAFFDLNQTKDLLHIPRNHTFGTSPEVALNLREDIMQSQKPQVESLLKAGIRVLLYQGQFDWKDGVVSNEAWIRTLDWSGTSSFLKANRTVWRRAADSQIAGYWRSFQNLEQVVVLAAGHLVPMNQPLSAVDMLLRFLRYPRSGLSSAKGPGILQI